MSNPFLDVSFSGRTSTPNVIIKFQEFEEYFAREIKNVVETLAKSGVTVARRTLRAAKTEWGKSRMAGNHFGVRFAPYGRSEGREDTGLMYDSLSVLETVGVIVSNRRSGDYNSFEGRWGWSSSAVAKAPYIEAQEFGFFSNSKFDPVATAASGRASFKEGDGYGDLKYVPGAQSLRAAEKSVRRRTQAAFSAAWNQAVKNWNSDNLKGNPGTYKEARIR